ncbi:MAG: hypothetical protein ACTSXO_00620 [Candidatus Heimdallarchaeota archaeon]|nr:hypothetical protein [Candidatus Heimdallarchaeota archaeon]RLI71200.1 MAG: hypothetical protein DRP02_05480 [Candidatus Gerdarchaeota archaeon]RLI72222.1 MAG: hypothetical protein DRO91_04735 [Candidatus Heimdallarchaeota archaeon]
MRPPICAICDKDLGEGEGGLIYFKQRFSDRVWERKMQRINGVGHPPNAEWFCEKHYPRAKELQDLTIDKAIAIILKEEDSEKG